LTDRCDTPGPNRQPLPPWLRVKTGKARLCAQTREVLEGHGLHTVCENAQCPNIGECYSSQTATFLIMGNRCTRSCRFCAVAGGHPGPLDPDEPRRVAEAVAGLGLDYAVVTSVTRDDLPDGGAGHFAATITAIHQLTSAQVEVLTPDFQGNLSALKTVLTAAPLVFNHNVETVRRLCPEIRPQADYERSLQVLRHCRRERADILRKSGFMVGLGETDEELLELLGDLAAAGAQIVTIGQYLRPSRRHWPVARYVEPGRFEDYARWGREAGIAQVVAGPFVRSSYRAAEAARSGLPSQV
jgi:lipoyl synthase